MDFNKSVRRVVDTGRVELGTDKALKMALSGSAKMVVVARNMVKDRRRDLEHYCRMASVPVVEFAGTSIELGTVCGKPFPVSALSVVEEGHSDILKSVDGGSAK